VQVTEQGQLLEQPTVKIETVTAWQRGTLVLDDMPLPDSLAQMR